MVNVSEFLFHVHILTIISRNNTVNSWPLYTDAVNRFTSTRQKATRVRCKFFIREVEQSGRNNSVCTTWNNSHTNRGSHSDNFIQSRKRETNDKLE